MSITIEQVRETVADLIQVEGTERTNGECVYHNDRMDEEGEGVELRPICVVGHVLDKFGLLDAVGAADNQLGESVYCEDDEYTLDASDRHETAYRIGDAFNDDAIVWLAHVQYFADQRVQSTETTWAQAVAAVEAGGRYGDGTTYDEWVS